MGIRLGKVGVVALGALVGVMAGVGFAVSASASSSGDKQLAEEGLLVQSDFPAGFESSPSTDTPTSEYVKASKGLSGCSSYLALRKTIDAQPRADSDEFTGDSSQVSNSVSVFKSSKRAESALSSFGKKSVPKCLEKLLPRLLLRQYAKDPSTKGKIASVKVVLDPQDIAGLGDGSVVYEGSAKITAKDGTSQTIGLGNAAVLVDRAVSDYTYVATGEGLTEILQPAIDASVARLQAAITAG
jgi:hypothetical protein